MEDAEARLCEEFTPRIRVFARRHLRDPQAVDDFIQEILLIVIEARRAGRIEQPDRLGAFVAGVCRVTLRDTWRNARRRADLLARYGPDLVSDVGMPDHEHLDAARLEQCLEKLGEKERRVVVLTFYGGKDAREIAAALGLSDGNVRVVRHRALTRLQECVGDAAGGAS
jgi:RNA polymerase sigma-70 factor (ECF subfamily)